MDEHQKQQQEAAFSGRHGGLLHRNTLAYRMAAEKAGRDPNTGQLKPQQSHRSSPSTPSVGDASGLGVLVLLGMIGFGGWWFFTQLGWSQIAFWLLAPAGGLYVLIKIIPNLDAGMKWFVGSLLMVAVLVGFVLAMGG